MTLQLHIPQVTLTDLQEIEEVKYNQKISSTLIGSSRSAP